MSSKEKVYSLDDACLDFKSRKSYSFADTVDPMSKSIFTPNFETLSRLPPETLSRQPTRKPKKAPEPLPIEVRRNIQVLKMRSVLDPKRFYKRDKHALKSNKIQIGKVIDAPVDFYHSRLPRRQRKQDLVGELLADAEFRKYNKKRYQDIIENKRLMHRKLKRRKGTNNREKKITKSKK